MKKNKHYTQLIAPSHYITKSRLKNAESTANMLGFFLKFSPTIKNKYLFYAGDAKRRAQEINQAFKDNSVKLILTARGGNNTIEILPYLNYKTIKKNPKPIVGFSDITILLNTITQKCGITTIHGPTQKQPWNKLKQNERQTLLNCLNQKNYGISFDKNEVINYNKIKNKTYITEKSVGGCLSLIVDSLGTPYEIKTKNSILFLEDTNERGRRLYPKLVQLKQAGKLKKVKAVVLGNFHNCLEGKKYVLEFFKKTKIPVIYTGKFGHGKLNLSFPIGTETKINFSNQTISFNFKKK